MRRSLLLLAIAAFGTGAAAARQGSGPGVDRPLAELRASHVAAHVPDEAHFDAYLERDFAAFFAARGLPRPSVRFELLRRGPTQSGAAYPKYYLWVWVWSEGRPATSGAVRVAAVERQGFDVADYLDRDAILEDPERIGPVFPAALIEAIRARAASPAFPPR